MAAYCDDCGCRMYGGICSNCQEELYIYENQAEYRPQEGFSEDFMEKVEEQRQEVRRKCDVD